MSPSFNSTHVVHGKPHKGACSNENSAVRQTRHQKKASNRAVLREQNNKLQSEIQVLQQALVNLSLNDPNRRQRDKSFTSPRLTQEIQGKNYQTQDHRDNRQSNYQVFASKGQGSFATENANNSAIGGSFLLAQAQNSSFGDHTHHHQRMNNNIRERSDTTSKQESKTFSQSSLMNDHQKIYQELLMQAQANQGSFCGGNQIETNPTQNSSFIAQGLPQVHISLHNSSLNQSLSNTSNTNVSQQPQIQVVNSCLEQDQESQQLQHKNREYIKQRVQTILKSVKRGANAINVEETSSEKQSNVMNSLDQANSNKGTSLLNVSMRQFQPENICLNHSDLNSRSLVSPLEDNQNLSLQLQESKMAQVRGQSEHEQINTNMRYLNELDQLKEILKDLGQKENSMISQMDKFENKFNLSRSEESYQQPELCSEVQIKLESRAEDMSYGQILQSPPQVEPRVTTQYFDAHSFEREMNKQITSTASQEHYFFVVPELETRDQQLVEAQQHIEQQDGYIADLENQINEHLQEKDGLRSQLDEQEGMIQELKRQMLILQEENAMLRVKPSTLEKYCQTLQQPLKQDAEVKTYETVIDNRIGNQSLKGCAEKKAVQISQDFTLRERNLNQTEEKQSQYSIVTSPKNQSSYQNTPTRSALQQFMFNSSNKKRDKFSSQQLLQKSSGYQEHFQTENAQVRSNKCKDSKKPNCPSTLSNFEQKGKSSKDYDERRASKATNPSSNSLSIFITKPPTQPPSSLNFQSIQEEAITLKIADASKQANTERKRSGIEQPHHQDHSKKKSLTPEKLSTMRAKICQTKNTVVANLKVENSRALRGEQHPSLQEMTFNNQQDINSIVRTPSKNVSSAYQKASSILRQRYSVSSIQQNLTPVRQQRSANKNNPLSSRRDASNCSQKLNMSDILKSPPQQNQSLPCDIKAKDRVVQQIKTFEHNKQQQKTPKPDEQVALSCKQVYSCKEPSTKEQSVQDHELMSSTVSPCSQILQPYSTTSAFAQSNEAMNSIEQPRGRLITFQAESTLQKSMNSCAYSSFVDCNLQQQQLYMIQKRRTQQEEERSRELKKRIQAKEQRIQNLLDSKQKEKILRDNTYEERKERFKREVKERQQSLSKTPVKSKHQALRKINLNQSSNHQNSNKDIHNSNEKTLNASRSCERVSRLQVSRVEERLDEESTSVNKSFDSSAAIRVYRGERQSENKVKRRITVGEEEDETPMPLNVVISPVKINDLYQYEI